MSELRDRPRVAIAMAILAVLLVLLGTLVGLATAGGDSGPTPAQLARAERTAAVATRELRDLRRETDRLRAQIGELERDRAASRSRARRAEASAKRWERRARRAERRARRS